MEPRGWREEDQGRETEKRARARNGKARASPGLLVFRNVAGGAIDGAQALEPRTFSAAIDCCLRPDFAFAATAETGLATKGVSARNVDFVRFVAFSGAVLGRAISTRAAREALAEAAGTGAHNAWRNEARMARTLPEYLREESDTEPL